MSSITGQYLCADHTFKTANYIRDPENGKMYDAVFTIMNEFVQVVGQYMVQTKSWLEIQPAWKQVFERYKIMAGLKGLALEELVSDLTATWRAGQKLGLGGYKQR